jgi:endonuclease YncB( thermonuclease family)
MARRRQRPASARSLPFLRRRSTLWLVGALVALGVAAILNIVSSRGGAGPHAVPTSTAAPLATNTGPPAATPAAPTPSPALVAPDLHPDPARLQAARVVHIVDGDTIDVEIDGHKERIRYYGIDTPERGQPCFSEATARNDALVDGNVLLLPDARERDRYGRLLRYVFDGQDRSVDARLIAEGLAHAWRQDGAYRGELIALEDQTHAAATGCLWK